MSHNSHHNINKTGVRIVRWMDTETEEEMLHPPQDLTDSRYQAFYDPDDSMCTMSLEDLPGIGYYHPGTEGEARCYERNGLLGWLQSGGSSDPETRAPWGQLNDDPERVIRPAYPLGSGIHPRYIPPAPRPSFLAELAHASYPNHDGLNLLYTVLYQNVMDLPGIQEALRSRNELLQFAEKTILHAGINIVNLYYVLTTYHETFNTILGTVPWGYIRGLINEFTLPPEELPSIVIQNTSSILARVLRSYGFTILNPEALRDDPFTLRFSDGGNHYLIRLRLDRLGDRPVVFCSVNPPSS